MCQVHIRMTLYCEWSDSVIVYDSHLAQTKVPQRDDDQPVLSNADVRATLQSFESASASHVRRLVTFRCFVSFSTNSCSQTTTLLLR